MFLLIQILGSNCFAQTLQIELLESFDTINIKHGLDSLISTKKDSNLNTYGPELDMSIKEAWNIYKHLLYHTYGRRLIRSKRPYFLFSYKDYYYFRGSIKKLELGGVFILIINKKTERIVFLCHGK